MRRLLLLLAAVIVLLSSCATSVEISYMRPGDVDMGAYRNIALASTVPFKGLKRPSRYVRAADGQAARHSLVVSSYDTSITKEAAELSTRLFLSDLEDTGFFQITGPSVTDRLISLSRMGYSIEDEVERLGIDAFVIPRIVSMDIDEYISSEVYYITDYSKTDDEGRPLRIRDWHYYLTQSVSLVWSYTVIDADTMTVYVTKNFSDKIEETFDIDRFGFFAPDPMEMVSAMLDSFTRIAALQLAPSRVRTTIELVGNDPKLKSVEDAYKLVDDGYLVQARDLFLSAWQEQGHVPSACNAAILMAVTGDIDGAISLLDEADRMSGSTDVDRLLSSLTRIRSLSEAALSQMDGTSSPGAAPSSAGDVFTLVMGA